MGTIALSLPQTGLPNSTEDVKVTNDLTILQTLVNGNIDTNNLAAAAGITFAQLAAGAGRPNVVGITGNTTAASGNLYVVNSGNPLTITLPAPTQNALIGIFPFAATGAAPVTVNSPANVIGLGLLGTSFTLGASSSCVVLMGNSTTNWVMVSGQQDTGWVALTLPAGVGTTPGSYTPSARLQGDMVKLKGSFTDNSAGVITTLATIPVGLRPSAAFTLNLAGSSTGTVVVNTNGTLTNAGGIANGGVVDLNGTPPFALS